MFNAKVKLILKDDIFFQCAKHLKVESPLTLLFFKTNLNLNFLFSLFLIMLEPSCDTLHF